MKKDSFSINPPPQKTAPVSRKSSSPRKKSLPPLPWLGASVLFGALLVIPLWAVVDWEQRVDWRILGTYFILISGLTFFFYWSDKRKAQQDQWRIPEGTLHLLELLGGWPAGLLAQRFLRHKTRKARYQVVFWLIVLLHQLLAFEFVSDWHLSRWLWEAF